MNTKEYRAMMAANDQLQVIQEFANGVVEEAATAQRKKSVGGVRADLGGQFFRSTWEANYARWLNWLMAAGEVTAWEYEPETFYFPDQKRGVLSYTPDFRITWCDGRQEWIEIKGYMDSKSRSRAKKMAKHHPGVEITLIDAKAYRAIANKVSDFIPNWEFPASNQNPPAAGR